MLSEEVMHVIESQRKQMHLMRKFDSNPPFSFRSFTLIWHQNIDMILVSVLRDVNLLK